MDMGLKNKVIIVTGGASGIGAAIVESLRAEGAIAVVFDRSPCTGFGEEAQDQTAQAEKMQWHTLDLRDDEACAKAISAVRTHFGQIDGVVNNAGVNDGVGLDAGPDAFRTSLELNLVPAYTMIHLTADALRASKGAVVNVASKVALTGQGGTSAYAAAKGGMLALTREWAADFLADGVRVNAVIPAEVMTPMYRNWLETFDDPEATAAGIFAKIPFGQRITTAQEMADAVVFLLSPRSGHTTGQWHHVDGGYVHLDRGLTG